MNAYEVLEDLHRRGLDNRDGIAAEILRSTHRISHLRLILKVCFPTPPDPPPKPSRRIERPRPTTPPPDPMTAEQALVAAAQQGDASARAELLRQLDGKIAAAARAARRRGNPIPEDDLRQLAAIGCLKAIRDYDPTRNARLSTYALIRMRGEIADYCRTTNPLGSGTGRAAAKSEIATRVAQLNDIHTASTPDGQYTADAIRTIDSTDTWTALLATLHEPLRTVIDLRFAHDATMRDVGRAVGLSESRISQLLIAELPRLATRLQRLAGELPRKPCCQ